MNIHIFYDNLAVLMAEKTFKNFRFFSESLESQPISDTIRGLNMKPPEFTGESLYEVPIETGGRVLDPAFLVARWRGDEYPTIIYHHGNNERPFDFGMASKNSFKKILLSKAQQIPANLIALRAPFHTDLRVYMQSVRHLNNFTEMLSASVCLAEALIEAIRQKTEMPVILAGISLGGWIANLHKAYLDTADYYVPLLAGADLAEVFLTSRYSRLTGQNALDKPTLLRSVLNFREDYLQRSLENVFPLLARYDQFIEYESHIPSYNDREVKILDKGHTTSALANKELRKHILQVI